MSRAAGRPRLRPTAAVSVLGRALMLSACAGLLSACAGTSSAHVEVNAPSTTAASTTTTAPPDCAELLPPAARAGQLIMVMESSPELAEPVLTNGTAGGFGLKGRQSTEIAEEVAAAVADAPLTPFVASDEEGGTVQRLHRALGELPSASEMGDGTPQESGVRMGEYAEKMVETGFNMVFGPVADVGSGSELGSRTFGDDAASVSDHVDAIVSAQQSAGLISVVKHWPGIGSGDLDPHVALDELAPIDELRAADLTVFESAFEAGAPAVMVSHSVIPGLTGPDEPATLSRAAITDELRGRQGFAGIVITDSLGMGAVVDTVPQDEAAERAIAAGADIALVSGADVVPAVHQRLTEAIESERIPPEQVEASVRRVLTAKGVTGQCLELVAAFSKLSDNGDVTTSPNADGGSQSDGGSDSDGGAQGDSGSDSDSGSEGDGGSEVRDRSINDEG